MKQQSRMQRSLMVLSVAGALAVSASCKHGAAPSPILHAEDAAPVRVTVASAVGRRVPVTLSLTGTLTPDQTSDLTPLVAGRVMEVNVERGSPVHAGDAIMTLRDVDYRSSAATAQAALSQAQARLGPTVAGRFDPNNVADVRAARANRELADDALRRAQQLAQTGAISDQDLQRATQQAAAAREQFTAAENNARASFFALQSAQVAVSQSQRNVNDSIVRAPFDGEIAERRANVGEYVTTQRAVVTLVRTDPLRVELQVPQERIADVHEGQAVDIRVDSFPGHPFPGTVRFISPLVRSDSRSLVVEALVPNSDAEHRLRPGVFVTARLAVNRQQDVVVVPPSALVTESGTSRAFVVVGGRIEERVVTIADRTDTEVLLGDGVRAGERVATDQLARLSDGSRVTE